MGDAHERRLVAMFNDTPHWWAQRAAASGSGGEADLPDVTFAHNGIAFAGEEKTSSEPYVYVDEAELRALRAYADAYAMRPVVLGRFKQERAFYVWSPDDMGRTDAGTYRGDPEGDSWAAKIAAPDGTADGVPPAELTSFALSHALAGQSAKGMIEAPPASRPGTVDAPDADAEDGEVDG